ncbi:LysR family transcriptional regulator [Paraburkholderia acidisoli]|uniref:LysR family transcriptional regulator n=1 Tax=Paraburkholderia acidisoli TaxID=2571748 RepID=A0A7Z2GSK0_9BURK|nr:LysR family transcriptional regulator [Paraburkholderia acidisoli]QGZ66829.1 LysR family transcriptional regulator [Paraburkholderia acidisoli]
MSDPDLNLLLALDAVLAEQSVAGAARRLSLSASAMSRTLTRLREATGDPLLVRAGRRMVLTPHAQALRERARHAAHEARAVLSPSVTEPDFPTLRRTFTVRANEGFVEAFGAPLIAALTAVAPGVRLHFAAKLEKSAAQLREGAADLEIGVLGAPAKMGPEIRIQALFRDRFVGVVRKGHALEAEREITAARYASFGHVVASRSGRASGPVDEALAALGLERHIAAVVPSFPAALAVARASDLIALLPASYLRNGQASIDTHRFELPVSTASITVSQMWHPRLDADAVHAWLRRIVLDVCRREAPS